MRLKSLVVMIAIAFATVASAQSVVFHNTLGSAAEIAHSAVGPPLVPFTGGDGFVVAGTAAFGAGQNGGAVSLGQALPPWTINSGTRNRLFTLDTSVLNPAHGAIEVVFKLIAPPVPYGGYTYLNLIDGPYGDEPGIGLTVADRFYNGSTRLIFYLNPSSSMPTGPGAHVTSLADGLEGIDLTGRLNEWLHVSVSWNRLGIAGSNQTIRMYLNGQLAATSTASTWLTAWAFPTAKVGGCTGAGIGAYWIDDLKIWSTSLSGPGGNPVPTLTASIPSTVTIGVATQTLALTGTKFLPTSTVEMTTGTNTVTVTPTYLTSTSLAVQVPPAILAIPGDVSIAVKNPPPLGGTSASRKLTILDRKPILSTITPTSIGVNSASAAITLTGDWFNVTSLLKWNATTFLQPSSVTRTATGTTMVVDIPASLLQTAGVLSLAVKNPLNGGGTSSTALSFEVRNPVPVLTSLSPTNAVIGTSPTVTLHGAGFVAASRVRWNNVEISTTYVNATTLTAVPAPGTTLPTAGTVSVFVRTPFSGGQDSASLSFVVNNPTPLITSLSPNAVLVGGPNLTLTVDGSDFQVGAQILWHGSVRTTARVSANRLTTLIPASVITTAQIIDVQVKNPDPSVGLSTVAFFTVQNPVPVLSQIATASTPVLTLTQGVTLTLTGSLFRSQSIAYLDNDALATTYNSPTVLQAYVPSSALVNAHTWTITVRTPTPGGGTSGGRPLSVVDPQPVLSGFTPSSGLAGSDPFQLRLKGSNFRPNSTVQWNHQLRPSIYVNPSELRVDVTAADLTVGASVPIMVETAGGVPGSASATQTFVINNPRPAIASFLPATVTAGDPVLHLVVSGAGLTTQTTLRWFVGNTSAWFGQVAQVSGCQLPTCVAFDIQGGSFPSGGNYQFELWNPAPGGGVSAMHPVVTANNPVPILAGASPDEVAVGSPGIAITLTGSGFVPTSQVLFGSQPLAVMSQSQTTIVASLPPGLISGSIGFSRDLWVRNHGPNGVLDTAHVTFNVNNPVPTIIALSPGVASPGPGFYLQVVGVGFTSASHVRWQPSESPLLPPVALQTTYSSSSSSLSAFLSPALLSRVGVVRVDVDNPTPGGGASNGVWFEIGRPVLYSVSVGTQTPIVSVMPMLTPASPPVTLWVRGSSFTRESTVFANGSLLATTYQSSMLLSATLPNTVLQTRREGGIAIAVETPTAFGAITTGAIPLEVTNHRNAGTIQRNPCAPAPGAPFVLAIEGCPVGNPFTLYLDPLLPAPVLGFPTPAADFVLAVDWMTATAIIDGLGWSGPQTPNPPHFAPYPGTVYPNGAVRLAMVAPPAGGGTMGTLQAVYTDPTSPVGYGLTHAYFPITW